LHQSAESCSVRESTFLPHEKIVGGSSQFSLASSDGTGAQNAEYDASALAIV
jgi:hypothetical protein